MTAAGKWVVLTSLAVLSHCVPARADHDSLEVRFALQEMIHQAVGRASAWTVTVETIGGAQQRDAVGDILEGFRDDGTPTDEGAFQDTMGSSFLVADGPTTGIIYEPDGWILTSSFNFVRDPSHVTVRLADGRQFVADLVARDRVRKLALLKIDAADLPTPQWSEASGIRVGQTAIALGRGFGGTQPSVTVGIVSALGRMLGNAVQTDAKLSPANYGGPLIDLDGRCLGICVPMAQRPGDLAGVELYDAGVGFALHDQRVREIVQELKTGKSFDRGWLGVQIDNRYREALKISSVANPSPVWELGIRVGDLITQANGNEIRNIGHLRKAIYMVPAGEPVWIVVRRGDLDSCYEVVLAGSRELGPLEQGLPNVGLKDLMKYLRGRDEQWLWRAM